MAQVCKPWPVYTQVGRVSGGSLERLGWLSWLGHPAGAPQGGSVAARAAHEPGDVPSTGPETSGAPEHR